jgi:3-oxoacyl-[acyl-carrier protein] reductase
MLENLTLAEFDRVMAINVRAVFAGAQRPAHHMRAGGRIITIGSVNGERMPMAGGSIYAMSKAAVSGLTRGLARDLGPRAITVNVIAPGPTHTEGNPSDGPMADAMIDWMALDRFGTADEVAGLVAYVASPEAAFITGAILTIDGRFAA